MVAPALLALALGTLGAIADIPKPQLHSPHTAVAGEDLWVNCSLSPNAPKDTRLNLVAQNRFGLPLNGSCSDLDWFLKQCQYWVPEDEEGELNVSCEAEMMPYGSRREWKQIRVHVKPRLDCPAQLNWTEGENEILDCRTRGIPDPELNCTKDGITLPVGTPLRAERIHAGIYLCRARNYLGSAERNVTVWVQYSAPDSAPFPLLPVLLGLLLPALALLVLTGLYWWHRHSTKVGEYWLWKRHPRPPGHQGATKGLP
ncbi:intercellular adhesion molecule 1-like [Catharus ustulatus]|uniref:intercellular adhesion molecule 1-like n=1 Tax=Catharus ustulatus TaxID=91951 RepID=UPI00140CD208|nr:intercellular adhesion molecule 1-like [Catharus ustulatus]